MAARFARRKTPTPKYKFEGHEDTIWSVVFLHDNVHIVSGSLDGTLQKWNCNTGRHVGKPWRGEGGDITALALSPDGKIIVCGSVDGSVQRWTINGKIISNWMGHSKAVRSVSWSPNGEHIASGSSDGTILIRRIGSGEVETRMQLPLQQDWAPRDEDHDNLEVWSLSYSPSGDRIASGWSNCTISIWNTTTGERVVGPIGDLRNVVTSLVWSSDSSKLYCASDKFARVFDTIIGEQLHCYTHEDDLYSVALSPKHNVLACVGWVGIAQLWNTESHHQLGRSFCLDRKTIRCVSFSRDGRYLAYGGYDGKLTLWMVKDIAPELTHQEIESDSPSSSRLDADVAKSPGGDGSIPMVKNQRRDTQETRPESSSSSFLNVDASGGGAIEGMHDSPYNDFFPSPQKSLPAMTSGPLQPPSVRHFWNMIMRHRSPTDESVPRERPKRGFFARRTCLKSPLGSATTTPSQPTLQGNVPAAEDEHEGGVDDNNTPESPALPAKLNSEENRNIWRRLMGVLGQDLTSINTAPAMKRPEVVDVYAVRGFRRLVVMTPRRRKKSSAVTCSAPLTGAHMSGTPQLPSSSSPAGALLQASSGQGGSSSPAIHEPHYVQVVGGSSSHASGPSHFVTTYHANHDSDSRSSIEGSCNRFLDRICFPCGHYY